jgi:hypothetical protein
VLVAERRQYAGRTIAVRTADRNRRDDGGAVNNPDAARRQPAGPSVRLIQVLRTYCTDLRPEGLADLAAALREGRYGWLRVELDAAIRGADTPEWWDDAIGRTTNPFETRTDADRRAEQAHLWQALFGTVPNRSRPRDDTA